MKNRTANRIRARLLGRRDDGAGNVDVYDASLTVLALGAHEVYLPMILRAY